MTISLLESGLTPDLSSEKVISLKAFNLFTLVATVVALVGALAWFLDAGFPRMAIVLFIFAFVFIGCYFLNMLGMHDVARFSLLTASGASFAIVSVYSDFATSFHYNFVLGAVFPFLAFTRKEKKKIAASLVISVAFIIITILGHKFCPVSVDIPKEIIARMNISNLVSLFALIGSIILYYVFKVQADLERERQRARDMLERALPREIADRLAMGESVIADSHGEATIMFADLVGFSQLSSKVTPDHLVEILNQMFSEFDKLTKKFGIEKIKTIGDCYMAAGGVIQRGPGQCVAVVNMALEILQVVDSMSKKHEYPMKVRVGIHMGPVISGVIGAERWTFDLWGDTVNIASRLESSGVPGKIHVSESVFLRLKKLFEFEPRGKVELKGMEGKFSTFFLVGRREEGSGHLRTGNVIEFG